jgi:glycine/D-amino acid oxidase-like deaminating enzyme
MVSSFHASFYAQDQVAAGTLQSYYATARDFYEYNEQLLGQFRHRVIEDRVASVENHSTHSLVRTTRGRTYKAHNVVFATGLTRPQNETTKNFDVGSLRNQTVVFGGTSDTINMMVSRAVLGSAHGLPVLRAAVSHVWTFTDVAVTNTGLSGSATKRSTCAFMPSGMTPHLRCARRSRRRRMALR